MKLLSKLLTSVPRPAQHQGSVTDQMTELRALAAHFGLYDADDWIQREFFEKGRKHGANHL
jgi:hypothetical protein